MSLLLLHLIFVTLLLDDCVHPRVLKSTYRSSIMSIASHIILVINTTPVVKLYPFQSGKLFLLHLLHGDVDLHGDDLHHVDVKHLEVIQDLQTIHVPIIEKSSFIQVSGQMDLIFFNNFQPHLMTTLRKRMNCNPHTIQQQLHTFGKGGAAARKSKVVRAGNPPVYQNRRPHSVTLAISDNARSAR